MTQEGGGWSTTDAIKVKRAHKIQEEYQIALQAVTTKKQHGKAILSLSIR